MQNSKVDLGHLMDAPTLSPDVAARLFSTVEDVEVDINGDIMAAAIAPEPGSLANAVAVAHRALNDLVRSAPDSPATRDFMSTTKTKYPSKYTKYFPTYNYMRDCHTWSMTKEESIAISEEAGKCLDNGDLEGYIEWSKKLPLPPNMALQWRDDEGKEALLASGANLADAEIVYGKDWLDNYMIDENGDE